MAEVSNQVFVIALPSAVGRRALESVDSPLSPYGDLNELIRIAIENQLSLDQHDVPTAESPRPRRDPAGRERPESQGVAAKQDVVDPSRIEPPPAAWFRAVERESVETVETPIHSDASGLGPLTNRIAPLLVGARVLAASTNGDSSISVDGLIDRASRVARHLAGVLRESDRASGRKGADKWSIGWPAGKDPERSLMRYRRYFLIDQQGTEVVGPMVDLGLCSIVDGAVVPTERCVAIASEPSGVFGESDVLMTQAQIHEFMEALVTIDAERAEMAQILTAVSVAGFASVSDIDQSISDRRPEWSDAQTTSHRAAICGRLHQLTAIESTESDSQSGFTFTANGSRLLDSINHSSGSSR